eukprot:TRINITY_DN1808_c0_g1_i1.p1 TRINITY_DN1808_c0_g1~~TRINITY_DN1808_c0_g1_i1.p1  ORF type:complete len:714 (+),score=293.79 TRINITY_DN1808_c0_g1_i1:148-2289(+)
MAQLVTAPLVLGAGAVSGAAYAVYNYLKPSQIYSVDASDAKKVEGEGIPRRSAEFPEILSEPAPDVHTVHDILLHTARKYPQGHAFGTRPLKKIHSEEKEVKNSDGKMEKKKWTFMELGDYEWKSYSQVKEEVINVGNALVSEEFGSLKAQKMLGIYADTSAQWLSTAHGCFSQNIVVVTIYANLGEEGLIHAINDTSLTHLLTDGPLLPALYKILDKVKNLKYVFYTTHREQADEKVLQQFKDKGIKVFPYDDLLNAGKKSGSQSTNPPKKEDLAVIMYTSGTTGVPKGVMITHANIAASVAGGTEGVGKKFGIGAGDTYCSFLPLAHILELVVEHVIMFLGGELAFGSPRSMMDNMVKNCRGDLVTARPTLMAGVPVLWERIRKGAQEKLKSQSWLVQSVFNAAYQYKYWMLEHGYSNTAMVNNVVFNKFREQVGGRLRGLVSGGAPLSKSTHLFLRIVFSCPAIQGYGLTETTGLVAAQPVDSLTTEVAGAPIPCGEVKLVDVKEMGYTSEDKPFPRGEIWARGPQITKGYYNQPEKTKEEYKEGGWFATGDIGQWNADGTISIVDRKKNLVKLSHGEYIALESMESKYKQDPFVEEICVVANSQRDLPAAIVHPNKKALQEWASSNGKSDLDWHDLCKDKEARAAVKSSLHKTAANERMKTFEKPSDVFLASDEWTPENGLMTSAMKLKRNEIQQKYKKEIGDLFPAEI